MAVVLHLVSIAPASAQVTAFKQAIAEAAAKDKDLAAFYKANKFKPIWVGRTGKDRSRREAFIKAVRAAPMHGLPAPKYAIDDLVARMKSVKGAEARAQLEVDISTTFLEYATDMQTGAVDPRRIDPVFMVRQVPYRSRVSYLTNLVKSSPRGFFKALAPRSEEYARLMKAKLTYEKALARGGWGPKVPAKSLKPGASGAPVVALRNRLVAMGYMKRSSSASYDGALAAGVQQFQLAHGLTPDGVAGAGTMIEINTGMDKRLQSIIVAMERERWMNIPEGRGKRHVLVNIPDFTAKIMDNGKVTFETITVVGKNDPDRETPEFSDVMEFMVINPSWYVPRSIATKEYLPLLRRNSGAVRHLEITDSRGRVVNRGAVNFAQYNERNFPFNMRQPPSRRNALGLVKFMFPNKHNIYLHDTPAKNLFDRERRDFSHGCVRLGKPFDFAYALLARQESNPEAYFQSVLNTGSETRVNLKQDVPVHIIYRTAYTTPKGQMQFRRDVYNRDRKIFAALSRAGVSLRAVQG
nr:L,D-transpeptidase family protein [Pseudaestuariivita atlantica]